MSKFPNPTESNLGGTRFWTILGDDRKTFKYHREDGPAIEWYEGAKEWFHNDKHHRENGPAIIFSDGTKHWYLHGVEYSCVEWMLRVHELGLK